MERLAEIYETICKLEDKEHMNSIKAKKYIRLVKEAEILIEELYDGWGLEKLKEDRLELENDLVKDGYVSATQCNLGARIQIHMACREYNLFGKASGWAYCEKIGKHWVDGDKTICGEDNAIYTSEPSWNGYRGCKECKIELFNKVVADILKKYPKIKKDDSLSGSAYGISYSRSKGVFRLEESEIKIIKKRDGTLDDKRVETILLEIPDIGYE